MLVNKRLTIIYFGKSWGVANNAVGWRIANTDSVSETTVQVSKDWRKIPVSISWTRPNDNDVSRKITNASFDPKTTNDDSTSQRIANHVGEIWRTANLGKS